MMKPKKIYSKFIPFKGYIAILILFWMVVREEYRLSLPWFADIHETIHLRQELEMGIILFYVWFVVEFLVKLMITLSWSRAYRSVAFEQEAYRNQLEKRYLDNRRHYAWIKYVFTLTPRTL